MEAQTRLHNASSPSFLRLEICLPGGIKLKQTYEQKVAELR